MKVYFVVFWKGILWVISSVLFLYLTIPGSLSGHPDFTQVTYFQVILVLLVACALFCYFYQIALPLFWGRNKQKELIQLDLPSSKNIDYSVKGCKSVKFIFFSRSANFSSFCGEISLRNARGEILNELVFNKIKVLENENLKYRSRLIMPGKGSIIDPVYSLSLKQIEDENSIIQVHLELDWVASEKNYRQKRQLPLNSISIEITLRVVEGKK